MLNVQVLDSQSMHLWLWLSIRVRVRHTVSKLFCI